MKIIKYVLPKSKNLVFGLTLLISLISTSSFATEITLGTETSSNTTMTVFYDDATDKLKCKFNTWTYQCGFDIWNRASTLSLDGSQVAFRGSSLNAGDEKKEYTLVSNPEPGKEYSVSLKITNSGFGTCGDNNEVVFDKTIKVKVSGLSEVEVVDFHLNLSGVVQVSWTGGIINTKDYVVVLEGKSIADPSIGFQEIETKIQSSFVGSANFSGLFPGITYRATVTQRSSFTDSYNITLSDEISSALTSDSQLSGITSQAQASGIAVNWTNPSLAIGSESYVAVDRRRLDIGTNTESEAIEFLAGLGVKTTTIPSTYTDTDLVSCNDHEYTVRLVIKKGSFEQTIHSITSSGTSFPSNLTTVVEAPRNFTVSTKNTPANCNSDIDLTWLVDVSRHPCQTYWFDVDRYQLDNNGNKITSTKTTVVSKSAGVIEMSTFQRDFTDTGSKIEGATYQYEIVTVSEWPSDNSTYNSSVVVRTVGIGGTIDGSANVVSATINPTSSVTLTWNDLSNEAAYVIRRKVGAVLDQEFEVGQDVTSFTDGVSGSVASCVDYSYEVLGVNDCVPEGVSLGEVSTGTSTSGGGTVNLTFSADFSQTYDAKTLMADKGYERDLISLEWDIAQNTANLINQKLYRRLSSNTGDSILIATLDPGARRFTDNEADANVLYEYYLSAEAACGTLVEASNTTEAIGFRSPFGIINGRVEFEGGVSVAGAQIAAENPAALNLNKSAYFDGDRDIAIALDLGTLSSGAFPGVYPLATTTDLSFLAGTSARTFEFWAKPESYNGGSIFSTGDKNSGALRSFSFNTPASASSNVWTLDIGTEKLQADLGSTIKVGVWHHFAITYDGESLKLYVDGENEDAQGQEMAWDRSLNSVTTPSRRMIALGATHYNGTTSIEFYHGYLDEFRVWSKAKTIEEINFQKSGFLFGNEPALEMYLRMDEDAGDFFYDASNDGGTNFNRRHFSIARNITGNDATFSNTIPASDQLGYNGITDAQGNYTISYIRYRGTGELFNLVPFISGHEFSPRNRNLFIGQSVPVHNEQDFEDISAFKVTGTVFYGRVEKGDTVTYCPAEGLFLAVDGTIALQDGLAVTTDENGEFELTVPIGEHFISVATSGHSFLTGRFPAEGRFDFQEDVLGLQFIDNTQMKVIGSVVGGTKEGNKKSGFGFTKNNIGVATIIFDAGACFTDTVYTDELTGEYVANVFPLEYEVKGGANEQDQEQFIASNPAVKFQAEVLDLKVVTPLLTETDTLFDADGNISRIDTIDYHIRNNYPFRVPHTLSVLQEDSNQEFDKGEAFITTIIDGISDTINTDQFASPVFVQGASYSVRIKLTEVYSNNDDPSGVVYDTVGVTDAEISIANDIADENQSFNLDNPSGDSLYTFFAGQPNILIDEDSPEGAFLKRLEVTSVIGITSDAWTLDGYVLGSKPNGTSFVTSGPEIVEHVLRDPPGSNSSATITKESSFVSNHNFDIGGNIGVSAGIDVTAGAKIAIGLGVATVTEIGATIGVSVEATASVSENNDYTETVTFSEDLSTSDDPTFVGADADLFIGKSYNMNFGLSDNIEPILTTDCGGDQACNGLVATSTSGKIYQLGRRGNFALSPNDYGTYFVYTQRHIRDQLIPDLMRLRNDIIVSSPSYTSNLLPEDPNYAANNDNPVFGDAVSTETPLQREDADFDGLSYTFTKVFADDEAVVDSVRSFNEQIRLWREALKLNEETKANAVTGQSLPAAGAIGELIAQGIDQSGILLDQETSTLESNVSFSSGAAFTRSVTLENEMVTRFSWEANLSATAAISAEVKVSNTGISSNRSITIGATSSGSDAKGEKHSISYAFTLQDDDLGNFYSVDVLDGGNQNGPVFKTQGGTSSCPYEGATVTEFYEPGTVLNPATVQHERPSITITPATQVGIPSDEAAVYTLTLGNENLTFDQNIPYSLYLDPASNPNGARVTIDGQNVDRIYTLSAGAILERQLVVNKSPQQNDYTDLKMVFGSACQSSIFEEVTFSATFIPTCSNSAIITPLDQWTVNNSFENSLPITIGEYDLNFEGLDRIAFRYKPSTSAQWIERETFFNRETASADTLILSRTGTTTIYNWDISGLVNGDGAYDLQLVSYCSDGVARESEIVSGKIDRVNPHIFGQPSPADGVLSPNDEISIRFNETIDPESIVKNTSFDLRGVLNGTPIRHFTSVGFDGNDNVSIPNLNLGNEFTLEAWLTRDRTGTEEVFFTYGAITVGINASDELYVNDGTTTVTGSTAIPTGMWSHISMAYSKDAKQVNVYLNGVTDVAASLNPVLENATVTIGSTFQGNIHELRIWTDARSLTEVRLNYLQTLSGNEIDLAGYWPMDEGTGTIATDKTGRRPAIISANWRFAQEARGVALNGVDDHFGIDGSTVAFGPEEDFTLSFWFKSDKATNVTLFSNGKVDGAAFDHQAWAVGSDASGNLTLQSNGQSYPIAGDYLNGTWHHLALAVNRIGFANLYMDGQTVVSVSAQNFSSFAGNKIYFGTYGRFEGAVETMDNYLQGSVDEIRIWNVARQEDQIVRDLRFKQNGDEYGLFAYFPFERYTEDAFGQFVLTETLADESDKTVSGLDKVVASFGGGAAYTNATPAINIARPVQAVNFTYAINDDEIIITPTDDAGRIENTLLDITVGGLQDLNGNNVASPVTWTAYIDQNQVRWFNMGHQASISSDESYQFTATILNDGGEETDFVINDLPIWLSANPASGSISPLSNETVTFTVNEGLGIGNYQENILLSTDFGFDEVYQLDLTVEVQAPNWTVNEEDFEFSMSVIGQVSVEGLVSSDPNDLVAAMINGEIRGVASVTDVSNGRFLTFLTIYSNEVSADEVEFRIWDASQGLILSAEASPAITFVNEGIIGGLSTPVIISAENEVSLSYDLRKGWNWVSFPMTFADNSVGGVLEDLAPSATDVLKGFASFSQYDASFGWNGSMSSVDGLAGYKIYLNEASRFDVIGTPVELSESSPLFEGWNWISYLPTSSQTVTSALSGYPSGDGDLIKNQSSFAIYDGGTDRWVGTLGLMEAGKGYQLSTSAASELFYSNNSSGVKRVGSTQTEVAEAANFSSNMSLIVSSNLATEGYELLTYSNGALRGRTRAIEGRYFLTAHGDEETGALDFQFAKEGVLIPAGSRISYSSDAVKYITLDVDVAQEAEGLSAFPIPFETVLDVEYTSVTSGLLTITLYSVEGMKLETVFEGKVEEGTYSFEHHSEVEHGVYLLVSDLDGVTNTKKVIK